MNKSLFKLVASLLVATSGIISFSEPVAAQQAQTAPGLTFGADVGLGYTRFTSNQTNNAAKHYVGLQGHAEICGTGGSNFDLCGGMSGFSTFGKQSVTVSGTTIKTDLTSVGPYVKARAKMGQAAIAPYAGIARVKAEHSMSGLINSTTTEQSKMVFAGVEIDAPIFGGGTSLTLKTEMGRSVGSGLRTETFSIKPGLKVKF